MNEYLNEFLKDISFYFIILKFILYFTIGAILLVVLNKILRIFSLIFSKLSKEKLVDKLMFIFPASLHHEVAPFWVDETRISVSGNFQLVPNDI